MEQPISNGPKTRFQVGNPGGPGRPKGSRNQLGEDFLKALHEDFTTHGVQAITDARGKDPVQYIKVIASILPKELNVKVDAFEEMTDDELIERIHNLESAVNAALGRTGETQDGTQQAAIVAETPALPSLH